MFELNLGFSSYESIIPTIKPEENAVSPIKPQQQHTRYVMIVLLKCSRVGFMYAIKVRLFKAYVYPIVKQIW